MAIFLIPDTVLQGRVPVLKLTKSIGMRPLYEKVYGEESDPVKLGPFLGGFKFSSFEFFWPKNGKKAPDLKSMHYKDKD